MNERKKESKKERQNTLINERQRVRKKERRK